MNINKILRVLAYAILVISVLIIILGICFLLTVSWWVAALIVWSALILWAAYHLATQQQENE